MTIDDAVTAVLARLSDAQIAALASACRSKDNPPGSIMHVAAGAAPSAQNAVGTLAKVWAASPGLTGDGLSLALRIGLRARREADAARSRPVWTGPGAVGEQRLTAAVLHELVCDARDRILLVSFAAYTLKELAADLEAAVSRGCSVDIVFETEEDSAGAYSGPHSKPFGSVTGAHRWRWPAQQRAVGAVLHAKLLVIDGRRALVGSANLTQRALSDNLEAGVLIEDPRLSAELESHVAQLMRSGTLVETE